MAGQRIPGPIGTDTEPTVRIDSGTSARMATPPPGGICSTPDDGLKGPAYTLDLHALGWVDSVRAAQVVGRALNESWDHVARIVRQETDVVIDALVDLILPILALGIAVLVAGVVFSGGVFALGLALLEWLGLGFLAVEIGCALAVVGGYTSRGARRAVNSLFVLPHQRSEELTLAATDFARAQAELIKAVLMGIVALLLKNSAVTSSRKAGLPELLATVRKSRLGEGFAAWVETNWSQLVLNPRLRPSIPQNAGRPLATEALTPSQLTKQHLGTTPQALPTPKSRLAPGGGLQRHENAGGHLLDRHVGKTEAELLQRLSTQPKITGSSSFVDRVSAESNITDLLASKESTINTWLSGTDMRLRLDMTMPHATGISVTRGQANAASVSSVRAVLVRNPAMPTGYHILTGFPTPP